jgi:hypothetical protein
MKYAKIFWSAFRTSFYEECIRLQPIFIFIITIMVICLVARGQ